MKRNLLVQLLATVMPAQFQCPECGGTELHYCEPSTKKREPGCKCDREEGDSECPVHVTADEGTPGKGEG